MPSVEKPFFCHFFASEEMMRVFAKGSLCRFYPVYHYAIFCCTVSMPFFCFYISMLLLMLYALYAMIYADHSLCQW